MNLQKTHRFRAELAHVVSRHEDGVAKTSVPEGSMMQELNRNGGGVSQSQVTLDAMDVIIYFPWLKGRLSSHLPKHWEAFIPMDGNIHYIINLGSHSFCG